MGDKGAIGDVGGTWCIVGEGHLGMGALSGLGGGHRGHLVRLGRGHGGHLVASVGDRRHLGLGEQGHRALIGAWRGTGAFCCLQGQVVTDSECWKGILGYLASGGTERGGGGLGGGQEHGEIGTGEHLGA